MTSHHERFGDIAILSLETTGFEQLSQQEQALSYHLAQAGLWGRAISLQQGSPHHMPILQALVTLYKNINPEVLTTQAHASYQLIVDYLKTFFAHNGIYHSMSGQQLPVPFNQDHLRDLRFNETLGQAIDTLHKLLFHPSLPEYRTVQKDGVDVVQASGGNFYHNMSTKDVLTYRQTHYPTMEETPPFGFNERLSKKDDGTIFAERVSVDGLYGEYVQHIVDELKQALPYACNPQQKESIQALITFYQTGNAEDFDTHSVAWTLDRDSNVYFINGLIESYEDPLGVACTFESIVAFKNPIQTAKVSKITENIQWFEDHMPFDVAFKKPVASGLSASSVTVVSMAGETSPTLPLGINLPNSDWIRKVHGSKSVNLANVASSHAKNSVELRQALFLPEYWPLLERYQEETNSLHTDLHEIAGHGSGQLLPGVNPDVIGPYYSTIEEARADLVALYYIADPYLQSIGVVDSDIDIQEFAKAQYVSYFTNGMIGQLRRVTLGQELTQAHFKNRQLISEWLLDHCPPSAMSMVQQDDHYYIHVYDVAVVRQAIGTLLTEVQRIKSTGDFDAAKKLVERYGRFVHEPIHRDVLNRVAALNLPSVTGFMTPMIDKNERGYNIRHEHDFLQQQLHLTEQYVFQHPSFSLQPIM